MDRKVWKASGCYQKAEREDGTPAPTKGAGQEWVPTLSGMELTDLPLTSRDVFVLSFVDGRRSIGTIALLAGVAPPEQQEVVQRLVDLGALEPPPRANEGVSAQGDVR